jgi:hypothetical protein
VCECLICYSARHQPFPGGVRLCRFSIRLRSSVVHDELTSPTALPLFRSTPRYHRSCYQNRFFFRPRDWQDHYRDQVKLLTEMKCSRKSIKSILCNFWIKKCVPSTNHFELIPSDEWMVWRQSNAAGILTVRRFPSGRVPRVAVDGSLQGFRTRFSDRFPLEVVFP